MCVCVCVDVRIHPRVCIRHASHVCHVLRTHIQRGWVDVCVSYYTSTCMRHARHMCHVIRTHIHIYEIRVTRKAHVSHNTHAHTHVSRNTHAHTHIWDTHHTQVHAVCGYVRVITSLYIYIYIYMYIRIYIYLCMGTAALYGVCSTGLR